MIVINLDNTYEATSVSEDFRKFTFESQLRNGAFVELQILIKEHPDELLSEVYNLAFGPLDVNGTIDDEIILNHLDIGKMFSTILLFAISFLQEYNTMEYAIGIDGSNESRAYLYHRMFKSNQPQLSDIINSVGVDWYVKLLRNGTDIERDDNGLPLFKPRPEPFDLNRKASDLYRYYMFKLKK